MQKVNIFTRAAFWGSKNLPQNCVIHDKFSAIKSAWFVTYQCETPGNSEKYQETVWNRVKQSQTETLLVSSCCHKHLTFIYTTLHNILHQDFYPSWEIFTRASLAPLAPFCISELSENACRIFCRKYVKDSLQWTLYATNTTVVFREKDCRPAKYIFRAILWKQYLLVPL